MIELTITLALSSLLVAGSFMWYSSQASAQFYDGVRQIESQIKLVQTGINTNELPNPLPPNHQIFASAVTLDPSNDRHIVSGLYMAEYDDAGILPNGIAPADTFSPKIDAFLPNGIVYRGSENLDCMKLNDPDVLSNYNILPEIPRPPQTVTFRREPVAFNQFQAGGPSVNYANWGGDHSTPGGATASSPCGLVLQFVSVEKNGSDPRFHAEIVFNFKNTSYRLVTH